MSSRLDGDPESIGTARELVRLFLEDVEPGAGAGRIEEVLLVVSELVTNAVVYAPGPYTIEVSVRDGRLRIAVTDGSRTMPTPRTPRFDGSGGFGLPILDALADGVETRLHERGKTVSASLGWGTAG